MALCIRAVAHTGFNNLQHFRKNFRAGCNNITAFQVAILSVEVGHNPTCLAHDECTGSDVLCIKVELPETVGASRCEPGQVQRGRTGSANTRCWRHQRLHGFKVGVQIALIGIWEAGAE